VKGFLDAEVFWKNGEILSIKKADSYTVTIQEMDKCFLLFFFNNPDVKNGPVNHPCTVHFLG
jgi:hypothetical protein